jgi:hypothetical protein
VRRAGPARRGRGCGSATRTRCTGRSS